MTTTAKTERETGGPAFPSPPYQIGPGLETLPQHGMTLRDWFAGQALVGIVDLFTVTMDDQVTKTSQRAIAGLSYDYADAMLEARDRALSKAGGAK